MLEKYILIGWNHRLRYDFTDEEVKGLSLPPTFLLRQQA